MAYGICDSSGNLIASFVAPMSVTSKKPVFVSDTLSLKRKSTSRSAQRWEISTNLEPLKETANALFVNMVTLGYTSVVNVRMPQNYANYLQRGKTGTITGTGTVNTNTVTITWTGTPSLIPSGTFIRIGTDKKVYMTTENISANGSMKIYPNLRTSPVAVEILFKDDVYMSCYYDTDTAIGMSYTDGVLMDMGTIKLVEALI